MPYIALKRLQVGEDLWREIGEHVPEADTWKRPQSWLGTHIEKVSALPKGVKQNKLAPADGDGEAEAAAIAAYVPPPEPEEVPVPHLAEVVAEPPAPTPAAEAEAEATGVDVSEVEGTGQDGRVVKADVVAAAEEATAPEPA